MHNVHSYVQFTHLLVGMASEISKSTYTSVWIAQDTTNGSKTCSFNRSHGADHCTIFSPPYTLCS